MQFCRLAVELREGALQLLPTPEKGLLYKKTPHKIITVAQPWLLLEYKKKEKKKKNVQPWAVEQTSRLGKVPNLPMAGMPVVA